MKDVFKQILDKNRKIYAFEDNLEISIYCGYGYMFQIKDGLLISKINGAPIFNRQTNLQFTEKDWNRIKRQANKIGTPAHPKYKLN